MLEAVGKGIQLFASVELGLNLCFASMMESPDRLRAITVLNVFRSFEVKLQMVNTVASMCLAEEQLGVWRELYPRIDGHRQFRNKLAHWRVGWWPGARSTEEVKRQQIALVPASHSNDYGPVVWGTPNVEKLRPIFIEDIKSFHDTTSKLSYDLEDFSMIVRPVKRKNENSPISTVFRLSSGQ